MEKMREFKRSFLELLWIVKCCFTTFWFWLPVLFMGYALLQLVMVIYIHPLTVLIVPTILCIYTIMLEEKRFKLKYGIVKTKRISASHMVGSSPEPLGSKWEVERAVEEYERLLKESKKSGRKKG